MIISLKVTYENWFCLCLKYYIKVPSASANPGNVKKINPVILLVSPSMQACEKRSASDSVWQPISVCMLWMCALRKPYIRNFNEYGFKTHDFNVIDIEQSIWDTSFKDTALFWISGRGTVVHLHLKRHEWKQHVSASSQNRHFHNYIKYIIIKIIIYNIWLYK